MTPAQTFWKNPNAFQFACANASQKNDLFWHGCCVKKRCCSVAVFLCAVLVWFKTKTGLRLITWMLLPGKQTQKKTWGNFKRFECEKVTRHQNALAGLIKSVLKMSPSQICMKNKKMRQLRIQFSKPTTKCKFQNFEIPTQSKRWVLLPKTVLNTFANATWTNSGFNNNYG